MARILHESALARTLLATAALCLVAGCGDSGGQRTFSTPEEASEAFVVALEANDVDALLAVLGPEHRGDLVTDDWEANAEARERIARAAREGVEFHDLGDGDLELVLGADEWPLPIPLTQEGEAWRFDTPAGLEELLSRRIGRSELTAIAIARAYVDAQNQYAERDRDSDEVREYAQRLASAPGQRDGLYWESDDPDDQSPFGPLAKGAERYLDTKSPGDPILGYYFQILERQGPNPPGGAYDYVINGNMIAGFALVAYPAEHGRSGIMTFVANRDGRVYQKDIGAFDGMDAYDPDATWEEVVE